MKLTPSQQFALEAIRRRDGMNRMDFFHLGIRMPTVHALQKRGLVMSRQKGTGFYNTFWHDVKEST